MMCGASNKSHWAIDGIKTMPFTTLLSVPMPFTTLLSAQSTMLSALLLLCYLSKALCYLRKALKGKALCLLPLCYLRFNHSAICADSSVVKGTVFIPSALNFQIDDRADSKSGPSFPEPCSEARRPEKEKANIFKINQNKMADEIKQLYIKETSSLLLDAINEVRSQGCLDIERLFRGLVSIKENFETTCSKEGLPALSPSSCRMFQEDSTSHTYDAFPQHTDQQRLQSSTIVTGN